MFWVQLNAFVECSYCIVELLLNRISLPQSIVSRDVCGIDSDAFLEPIDCFFLLAFPLSVNISKPNVRVCIILVDLNALFIIFDCLLQLSSFLMDNSQVEVGYLIGRAQLNALLEGFY